MLFTDERHETNGRQIALRDDPIAILLHADENLVVFSGRTHRRYEATAGAELIHQRGRKMLGRRRDDDGVEGRRFRPAESTITDSETDVLIAECRKPLPRGRSPWRPLIQQAPQRCPWPPRRTASSRDGGSSG